MPLVVIDLVVVVSLVSFLVVDMIVVVGNGIQRQDCISFRNSTRVLALYNS